MVAWQKWLREFDKASGSGSRACVKLRKSQALAAGHACTQESVRLWQQDMYESGGGRQGTKKGGSSCEVMGSSSEILFASLWRKDMSKMLALYCIVRGSRSNV